MNRFLYWILVPAILVIAGCPAGSDEPPAMAGQDSCADHPDDSWRERYLELGHETYEAACASCHDQGKDDAPVLGDRESWSERSPLWAAVLLEHAKNGYLGMPAKGGQLQLSDNAVQAAGEYMLSETFPELPKD